MKNTATKQNLNGKPRRTRRAFRGLLGGLLATTVLSPLTNVIPTTPASAAQSDAICHVAGRGQVSELIDGPVSGSGVLGSFVGPRTIAVMSPTLMYVVDSFVYLREVNLATNQIKTIQLFPGQVFIQHLAVDRVNNVLYLATPGQVWRWPIGASAPTLIIGDGTDAGATINGVARQSRLGLFVESLAVDPAGGLLIGSSTAPTPPATPVLRLIRLANAFNSSLDATRTVELVAGNGTLGVPTAGDAKLSPLNDVSDAVVGANGHVFYRAGQTILEINAVDAPQPGFQKILNASELSTPESIDNGANLAVVNQHTGGLLLSPNEERLTLYGGYGLRFYGVDFTSPQISQPVTLLAGTGAAGYVDGPAASAQFAYNTSANGSAAYGPDGAIYVADTSNHRIRKILGGTVSTVAGRGAAVNVLGTDLTTDFIGLDGVAQDPAGNVYFAARPHNRVYRKSPNGQISVFAGSGRVSTLYVGKQSGLATSIALENPSDVAVDPRNGDVYILSPIAGIVRVRSGVAETVYYNNATTFNGPSSGYSVLTFDSAIDVGPNGDLYFSDAASGTIRKIPTGGGANPITVAGNLGSTRIGDAPSGALTTDIGRPAGLTVDANGNLFFTSENGIGRFDATTNTVQRIGGSFDPAQPNNVDLNAPDVATKDTITLTGRISVDPATGELFWMNQAGVRKVVPLTSGTPGDRYRNAIARKVTGRTQDATQPDFGNGGSASNAFLFLPQDLEAIGNGEALFTDSYTPNQGIGPDEVRKLSTNGCAEIRSELGLSALGSAGVAIDNIPASALPTGLAGYGSGDLTNTGVNGTPIGSTPIGSTPIGSTPIGSTPIGSTPIGSTPIGSTPIGSTPLLNPAGGWAALLAGTSLQGVPLQNITFKQVLNTPGVSAAGIKFSDLDLTNSPLASLSVASIALGNTTISSIPLSTNTADPYAGWCQEVLRLTGQTCSQLGIGPDATVFELDVRSVPIGSTPIGSTPIGSTPIGSTPIGSTPIGSTPIGSTPIGSTRLSSIDLVAAPIGSTPIGSTPIGSTILDCTKVNCNSATLTLRQAFQAGAIKPEATLGQIVELIGTYTLGQLAIGMPPSVTLGDFLLLFVRRADIPWEQIPLDKLKLESQTGTAAPIFLQASLRVGVGTRPNVPLVVTAELPPGFTYAGTVNATVDVTATPITPTSVTTVPGVGGERDKVVITLAAASLGTQNNALLDINIGARPGVATGPVVGRWTAIPTHANPTLASGEFTITTTDPGEPANNNLATPTPLPTDTLMVGGFPPFDEGTLDPVDYFQIAAKGPKGTRSTIYLSHLTKDADVVVYESSALPALRSGALRVGQTAPLSQAVDPSLRTLGQPFDPQLGQDVPPLPGLRLVGISAKRGTANETVEVVSDGIGGSYIVEVRPYNGTPNSITDPPYLLRLKQVIPPGNPNCIASPVPAGGAGVQGAAATATAGKTSVILVNRKRLGDVYGTAQVEGPNGVMARLDALAAATNAAVVSVDADQAVRTAYNNWDQRPCDADAANAVVLSINSYVDTLFPAGANRDALRFMTIVGGDDQIPMGRVPDDTKYSNESDYTADLLAVGDKATPLSAAANSHFTLTDDPFASFAPGLYGNRVLYTPDVALGRLVETPTEIIKSINSYLTPAPGLSVGQIDPTSSLVTGYDFLADGANEVKANLEPRSPNRPSLIGETWSKGDLTSSLFPTAGGSPSIVSLNAHFSHNEALPAAGNTTADFSDLLTTADISAGANADKLAKRILLSLGCHSGMSVPDVYVGASPRKLDWAQAFAQQGAVYIANTGFGYGDTDLVAYSEKLHRELAKALRNGVSIAQALRIAKNSYLSDGLANVYDPKVLMQTTYYGIPNYTLAGTFVPPTPPTPPTLGSDPKTSLEASEFNVSATPSEVPGPYYVVPGQDPLVADGRPIQPRTDVDVTVGGRVAHGALITSLTSTDRANFPVKFSRPTIDLAANEIPNIPKDTAYPSFLQNVVTSSGLTATGGNRAQQNLVLAMGQWFNTSVNPAIGTQRLFSNVKGKVFYTDPSDTDFSAPLINVATTTVAGSNVTFNVTATDSSPITRVLALYLDGGTWRSLDLTGGPNQYTGTTGTTSTSIDYFIQVVDSHGNVGVTSNKATLFAVTTTGGGTPVVNPEPPIVPKVNAVPAISTLNVTPVQSGGSTTVTVTGSFTDADSTAWTGTFNWGDGTAAVPLTLNADKTFTISKTFANAGTYAYTATATITDDRGGVGTQTAPLNFAVVAVNVAPNIGAINATFASTTGSVAATVSGAFNDADSTSWTGTIDWGDGSAPAPLTITGTSFSATKSFTTGGARTVTIKITDGEGASSTATKAITVPAVNTAPVVTTATATTAVVGQLVRITVNGAFTDATSTSWTGNVNWGDGTAAAPLTVNVAAKTFTALTTSFAAGTRTGTATICDAEGACGSKTFTYTVTPPARAKIVPVIECVTIIGNTAKVGYGYKNPNPYNVTIPVGASNQFIPGVPNRGQPTLFLPGERENAFSVVMTVQNAAAWILDGRTLIFSRNFKRCS